MLNEAKCSEEKGCVVMGYYLMRVSRKSHVDILVRANTADEANKNIDDWFDDRDNYDFNELMIERETDDTNIVKYFDSIEEYNRSGKIADFEIDMGPKQTEPHYDLYLIIDEEPCHFHRKVWQDLEMESVLNILREYNKQYILKKKAAQYNVMTDALKRNCEVLCYDCTKRED